MKRFLVFAFFVFVLSFSSVSHAGWISAGSYGGDDEILLNDAIQPVGKSKDQIYPNVYTLSYKISMQGNGYVYTNYLIDLQSGQSCPLPGKTEMLTLSNRNIYYNDVDSVWTSDSFGPNHATFAAYLWKNESKIAKKKPSLLSQDLQSGLDNRTLKRASNSQGWLQVYEKPNGNKAWIQTKSIQISMEEKKSFLPAIEMLIRYETFRGTQSEITYALETFNPDKHLRTITYQWKVQNTGTLTEKELPLKNVLPALVPDDYSAIATAGYFYDILNRTSLKITVGLPTTDPKKLPADWFQFN